MIRLVELLSDGQFHSGDALGEALGISRAAVWKQIKKLQGLGVDIFSVKGKGYCLRTALELLSERDIRHWMPEHSQGLVSTVDVRDSVTSTNDIAFSKAGLMDSKGYACFAEQQTQGRGRRGRHWVSPFGSNIYLSVVWHFQSGAAALEGLSIATGIAAAKALESLGCPGVCLKWPNDILVDGEKLGGVLLEMTGDPAGQCQVVVGIGLNMRLSEQDAAQIDQPFTSISALGVNVSRNRVAGALLGNVALMLRHFEHHGFASYAEMWGEYDAFKDKKVAIHVGNQVTKGIARGIDACGGLRLESHNGVTVYKGGELSMREVH